MKLELKNIKHSAFASHETHCYEASLYVDGKRAALVSNQGTGGCDSVWILGEGSTRIRNAKLVSAAESSLESLESWCCEQVNEFLDKRELKRATKKVVVYTRDGRMYKYNIKPDQLNKLKKRPEDGIFESVRRWLLNEHEGCTILNDLPEDEQLELWRKS